MSSNQIYYMTTIFEQHLSRILREQSASDIWAAVGVVQNRSRWLLGLAKNTGDDRAGTWCFPGGHVNRGESPDRAAAREVREETGVSCHPVGSAITLPDKDGVGFYHCRVNGSKQDIQPNHEFAAVGFFTLPEMRTLRLYHNVKKLIDRARRQC